MRLGASWGRLGAVLGRLEASKNASWERLGDVLGRLGTLKTNIENEADLKGENKRSGKPPGIPRKVFLEAKITPKPLQDAFEAALVLHHIFEKLVLQSWLDFPPNLAS